MVAYSYVGNKLKNENDKSVIIGELRQNDQFEDWQESELIEIPFFENKRMKITFMDFIPENDTEFIKEADYV